MSRINIFDVIVVGGGHAGVEAASAAARMKKSVLLVTHARKTIGKLSCNPAIGGVGKGQLVKEIDALGGCMGIAADLAGLQFRRLNMSKGSAVRSTRVQVDVLLYPQIILHQLEQHKNLTILEAIVEDLILEKHKITGIYLSNGLQIHGSTVVLATGTFLGGQLYVGQMRTPGGRYGEAPAIRLAERLREISSSVGRLKTGTPPRLKKGSIDFSGLLEQKGDYPLPTFSFMHYRPLQALTQLSCYITYTQPLTHDLIVSSLTESPLYSGAITGPGPRYCPSIEDKVVRFPSRLSHQIFLEPESLGSELIYPNGISTSLPLSIQQKIVNTLPGLAEAEIEIPGYAIEYDFLNPCDLHLTLHHRELEGLFLAGQINGTTGYEEAAAQGLLAGVNAALFASGEPLWCPRRHESYLGVLVDDLTTLGTTEPYRMFTSRAEYRLLLREDNADMRLTPIGQQLNLIDSARWQRFQEKYSAIRKEKNRLAAFIPIETRTPDGSVIKSTLSAEALLRRPEMDYLSLSSTANFETQLTDSESYQALEIQIKYAGYIERQQIEAERLKNNEMLQIPTSFIYADIAGLSAEVIAKLTARKPDTIGQASRIPGMTPAAISILLIHLKKKNLCA